MLRDDAQLHHLTDEKLEKAIQNIKNEMRRCKEVGFVDGIPFQEQALSKLLKEKK